ncbi:MAG TPA: hypothetical protein VHM27_01815 [Rhizomicrobium sp.]|nr:hypothetical protein [Rhizomicrobium sp.]
MRKQYHFRPGPDGLRAWDVDRLVALTRDLPVTEVPLSAIAELDKPYWYDHGAVPTCRSIAEHARLIREADLAFPIILSSDGGVMDGMHRVAKAAMEGRSSISARQFTLDPEPDYVGVDPGKLPY